MTAPYNVLWIFVDGVRRYHSSGDDRDRLDMMDEFSGESVEFKNVVTSAPSTFQALSAMASGMHSYYINRNFDDFCFDNSHIPSITQTLIKAGYHCYNFLMHKETRVILANVFPMVKRKYWPKGFTHQRYWNNDDILQAVKNTLTIGVDKPSFFFVDFNCRKDPYTSDKVKQCIERFHQAGYTDSNTITILCSDHGYPDPSKNMDAEFHRKHNLSHDAVLTDDNIMVPLLIQYPNCPQGKKIDTTVASLDIFPTILDILNLPCPSGIHGRSLLPLVSGNDRYRSMMESRFHRSDSRLSFQVGRATAIRNGQYKYVHYQDNARGKEDEFFDIIKDPEEHANLIDSKDEGTRQQLRVFKDAFYESEEDARKFQLNYLFRRFRNKYETYVKTAKNILITDSCKPLFVNMLVCMIREVNSGTNIHVVLVEHKRSDITQDVIPIETGTDTWGDLVSARVNDTLKKGAFDVLFAPYNTSEQRDNVCFARAVKRMKSKKTVYLDYNMEGFKKTTGYYWKIFRATWPFIKHEPSFLLSCCVRFLKYIFFRKQSDWAKAFKS